MARIDNIEAQTPRVQAGRMRPSLALVGLSHHTADFEELEQAAIDEGGVRNAVKQLLDSEGVLEAAVLATCNRTEIFVVSAQHEQAVRASRDLLRDVGSEETDAIYIKYGRDVASHLFRVAAGLDSLMVGEVQILGQVKQALRLAEEEQTAGAFLGRLFSSAFRAGKRARGETALGEGAVSVSYAALGLATKIFTDLRERQLLVVGTGETGELAAKHFADAGIGQLVLTNRTLERAEALAAQLGARAVRFEERADELATSDIVVTATASPVPVITRAMVEPARAGRANRPLVFIDIALPRDVDPAINELEGVFVHDMAALESIVKRNLERRRREIPKVESIIAQEVERFQNWESSLDIGPTAKDLRDHVEAIRVAALNDLRSKLDGEALARVDKVTRAMMNKLLHKPLTHLRRPRAGSGNPLAIAATVRQLFDLDQDADDLEP